MRILFARKEGIDGNERYFRPLRTLSIDWECVGPDDPVPPLSSFDGLLLPGGGDVDPVLFGEENCGSRDISRALDDCQLSLTDAFVKKGLPILGICRGHQVLNVYFGGSLIQDLPQPQNARHTYHDGRGEYHETRFLPGSILHRLYGASGITNSFHHQALSRLGKGLIVTAVSDDGVIEGMEHESLPILAAQFHPEQNVLEGCAVEDGGRSFTVCDGIEVFGAFKHMMEDFRSSHPSTSR